MIQKKKLNVKICQENNEIFFILFFKVNQIRIYLDLKQDREALFYQA